MFRFIHLYNERPQRIRTLYCEFSYGQADEFTAEYPDTTDSFPAPLSNGLFRPMPSEIVRSESERLRT
jgi:hypothetical protein